MAEKKKYALGSNGGVYAPGMVKWAINGAAFKKDLPQMIKVISGGWGIPAEAAEALLTRKVPYEIEGEVVVFRSIEGNQGSK